MPGFVASNPKDADSYDAPSEPCPLSSLQATLKQFSWVESTQGELGVLNFAFGGFLAGLMPLETVNWAADIARSHGLQFIYGNRIPRRYDGDRTLPPGRYSTLCLDESGNDGGTLIREMKFYMAPARAEGHFILFDSTLPADREVMDHQIGLPTLPGEARILAIYSPYASNEPRGIRLSISISIRQVNIEGVLDLRRPQAANWLARAVSNLSIDQQFRVFLHREPLPDFPAMIYGILDQAKGGGNLHKIVGLLLREQGVAGLVFPSVRGDVSVTFVNGEPEGFAGWSFVDFRDAPPPNEFGFHELRPDWPRGLTIEGGDGNAPHPPAFAGEVAVSTQGYETGTGHLAVTGLTTRMEAYYLFDSAITAIRQRIANDDRVEQLIKIMISSGTAATCGIANMALFSILGRPEAKRDLETFLPQIADEGVRSLLRECLNPPLATAGTDFYGKLFRKVIEGATASGLPEPAT